MVTVYIRLPNVNFTTAESRTEIARNTTSITFSTFSINASGFVLGSLKYNEVETEIAINNYWNVTLIYILSVRAYCTSSSVFVSFGSLQRR